MGQPKKCHSEHPDACAINSTDLSIQPLPCFARGLTAAMYLRGNEEVSCPDDSAGLHIRARNDEVVRADIKPDQLAFQVRGLLHPFLSRISAQVDALTGCIPMRGNNEVGRAVIKPDQLASQVCGLACVTA